MLSATDKQTVIRSRIDGENLISLSVTAFVTNRGISLPDDLVGYWIPDDVRLPIFNQVDSFEDLIWLFGLGISSERVRSEGAVYTPHFIRTFMVNQVLDHLGADGRVADLSCGCGAFLLSLVESMRVRYPERALSDLLDRIYGFDIDAQAIQQARILLSLYAASIGELIDVARLHLSVMNALSLPADTCFQVIIGNPPYVRLRNLPQEQVDLLGSAKGVGLTDLYLVFFQLSLDHLVDGGVACLITPNTWLTSLNGRAFRERLLRMRISLDVYDFRSDQVFAGRSTYTCIARFAQCPSGFLRYASVHPDRLDQPIPMEAYSYDNLTSKGWKLAAGSDRLFLERVAKQAVPLLDGMVYSNGIATCANDVFIFTPVESLRDRFICKDDKGRRFEVERAICKPLVRCSALCTAGDFESVCQQIIFPYREGTLPLDEDEMRHRFPLAYGYLYAHRSRLLGRDKGVLSYPWYAWGRTQGFRFTNVPRLVMPLMTGLPVKPYFLDRECFLLNGFCLVSPDRDHLRLIRAVLASKAFAHYLRLTSKPYQGGFFALMRQSIEGFRIPVFTESQKSVLLAGKEVQVDRLLADVYGELDF